MEQHLEAAVSRIRELVEECQKKLLFDDEIKMIREKFDQEVKESSKKLAINCASSGIEIQGVKEIISKQAAGKIDLCMKAINEHIRWAVEQRNQIEINARKQLVAAFGLVVEPFFEQLLKCGLGNVIDTKSAISQIGPNDEKQNELLKIEEKFAQELKLCAKPAKNLFLKDAQNYFVDIKSFDAIFLLKINSLARLPEFSHADNESESEIRTSHERRLFPMIFDTVNKHIKTLINEEKDLNRQMQDYLDSTFAQNLNTLHNRYIELKDDYLAFLSTQLEKGVEIDREFTQQDESFRNKIRNLLSELSNPVGKQFSFSTLAVKVINSRVDTETEQAWFDLYNQAKNLDQINQMKFHSEFLDIRSNLDYHLALTTKQAFKYYGSLKLSGSTKNLPIPNFLKR